MDFRKNSDWTVVEEGSGHRVLHWLRPSETEANDHDGDRLLEAPGLAIVDDTRLDDGYDPYNSGMFSRHGSREYDRGHGKNRAFARQQR